jgi:hypothetical protein
MQLQNITPDPAMSRPMHPMVWDASLSELFLNRVSEQVKNGVDCSRGFRERQLPRVCNDFTDFIGLNVTPT